MALHYVRFAELMPTRERDGAHVLAGYPGGAPFVLHWPTDEQHIDHPDCMWLQGARIPALPQPHEVPTFQPKRVAA